MDQKNKICRVELDYPCTWLYKVIGTDQEQLHQAISAIINQKPCAISISNRSSTGKYICLNLEITVEDEDDRNSIYMDLKSHPQVKIVL